MNNPGNLWDKFVKFIESLILADWLWIGFYLISTCIAGAIGFYKYRNRRWRAGRVVGIELGKAIEAREGSAARELVRLQHDNRLQADEIRYLKERTSTNDVNADALVARDIEPPADLQDLIRIRSDIANGRAKFWELRDPQPLAGLREQLLSSVMRIITVGNLKGGVGKTTISANLAAYFEKVLKKRVLVIDLDYQGSISQMMLNAADKIIEYSLAEHLLGGAANGRKLVEIARDLAPALPNTRLIPASYTLQDAEDELLVRWLFHITEKDVRFNLAEVLLSNEVKARFDIVILDVGPRLTTASISALCASTHLIVPSNLDQLSAETVESFLRQVGQIKTDLNLAIDLAGVVGTMTLVDQLKPQEGLALTTLKTAVKKHWPGGQVFNRTLPRVAALSNVAGTDIGYLVKGKDGKKVRDLFDALGHEIATRLNIRGS